MTSSCLPLQPPNVEEALNSQQLQNIYHMEKLRPGRRNMESNHMDLTIPIEEKEKKILPVLI